MCSRTVRAVAFLCSAALAAGCAPGGKKVTWVQVRGTVTCDGKPVAEGTVQFHDAATGEAPQADLRPDGTYEAKLPAANYAVAVVPQLVNATPNAEPNWVEKNAANIPPKYRNPAKSGFTADVPADGSKTEFAFAMTKGK